jgi:hypothetical protein
MRAAMSYRSHENSPHNMERLLPDLVGPLFASLSLVQTLELQMSQVDRYYDAFLQNSMRGQPWVLRMVDGSIKVGVPTAGSIFDPFDPNASFTFKNETGTSRFRFRDLAEASPGTWGE